MLKTKLFAWILASALWIPAGAYAQGGSFQLTGSLNESRQEASMVKLADGRVLISGGVPGTGNAGAGSARASAEIYDPATGIWALTGSLNVARTNHQSTLLNDDRVLVTGGHASSFSGAPFFNSAEIFDPATNSFTSLTSSMVDARTRHATALLPDGKVLILGGHNAVPLASAEIFDPTTHTFTPTGSMTFPRGEGEVQFAIPLPTTGKVLVVGGNNSVVAELYDPTTGSFSLTSNLSIPRFNHSATLLPDGRVLVAGGVGVVSGIAQFHDTAEIYDPVTGTFTLISSVMSTPRHRHRAALTDGKVLVAGGHAGTTLGNLASADLFDPVTETFVPVGSMTDARFDYVATSLDDGRVLVAAGAIDPPGGSGSIALSSAEVFLVSVNTCSEPTAGLVGCWPFNGNANDESGFGNDGTVNGAVLTTDRFGNPNGAYMFDGVDDLIDFGDVDIFDGLSETTISLWIRYSTHSDFYDPFITKGQLDGGGTIQLNQSTIDGNRMTVSFTGAGGASAAHSSNSADDGNWHHITATLSNQDARIYIDGALTSTTAVSACDAIINDANPLTLAYNSRSTGEYWYGGDMDDVRIYNRALSEEEIQTLFQEGANQPPIAGAGLDQTIECASPAGTSVPLDGTDSTDPDDDPLTFTWTGPFPEGGGTVTGPTPTVTLPLGTHTITLTVEDGNGGTDSDDVEITVKDMTPPEITVAATPIVLWPPNHKYHTINLSDFATGATDACDGDVSASLSILSVASDEPENVAGGGDGNTTDDIIIAGDCQSVDLRAERQGSSNGRVYTLTGATTDASGNTGEASFQVQVPHNKKGTATDNGVAYAVTCGASKRAALSTVEAPTGFELSAAYPNPFNPTTMISFALPEAAHVRLLVFDILGREVARLIDGPRPAGHHQAVFKADRLPSGTYLYRIEAGSFAETRTMLLLK